MPKPAVFRAIAATVFCCAFYAGGPVHANATAPQAKPPAQPSAGPGAPRPFAVYNGAPPRRIVGRTTIEGGRGGVRIEPVLQGDVVHHEIRLVNTSEEPWQFEDLRMCSGCMLDGLTKSIAPGATGSLRFVVPTDALGGQTVEGTIRALTGAADPRELALDVNFEVREFAALHPYRLWLSGRVGEAIEETAIVVPNRAYPFTITGIRTRKGVWIETALRETEYEGRGAFAIDVRNIRSKAGPYQDVLFVQTDHPERPELKIRIEGRIESATE